MILTTTASMSQFRLTCFFYLVLKRASFYQHWMNKERTVLGLCSCKTGASCISCKHWWPQLAQGKGNSAASSSGGQLKRRELGPGDGTLGDYDVTNSGIRLDSREKITIWVLKTDPNFSCLFGFFSERKGYFKSWKQQIYHLRVSVLHETGNPIFLNSFSFLKTNLIFIRLFPTVVL